MLVVDASVAVAAALGTSKVERIAEEELVAPPLLWSESPSALHEARWRGEIPPDRAREAFERLLKLPIRRRALRALPPESWNVAEELGWAKTYDAEYVALARLLGCRLVTLDARLRRGAERAVEVLSPAEL